MLWEGRGRKIVFYRKKNSMPIDILSGSIPVCGVRDHFIIIFQCQCATNTIFPVWLSSKTQIRALLDYWLKFSHANSFTHLKLLPLSLYGYCNTGTCLSKRLLATFVVVFNTSSAIHRLLSSFPWHSFLVVSWCDSVLLTVREEFPHSEAYWLFNVTWQKLHWRDDSEQCFVLLLVSKGGGREERKDQLTKINLMIAISSLKIT